MAIETSLLTLKLRRTRIVATVGPASSSPEMIAALIDAGVDVFRLNMSHGEHATHRAVYQHIRRLAEERARTIAILADLSGPKIRVGRFPQGAIELEDGAEVTITLRDVEGGPGLIPSQYAGLADDVEPGVRVLLDDGNLELRVQAIEGTEVRCRVVHGGTLRDRKGMNLPDVTVSAPALTEKDRRDAAFALELGVDLIALSFVQRGDDVRALRSIVEGHAARPALVSKIEKPQALTCIDDILAASDAIMVARGDLGVELPPHEVPLAQEQLIERARAEAKPVIVATQMLESMISQPRPTRAEVSDVAGAVRSGADAVMLSGETAVGEHPIAAVKMMDQVARQTEAWQWSHGAFGRLATDRPRRIDEAVSVATAALSRDLEVRAIVAVSRTGRTVSVMSAARPAAPLVAACVEPHLQRIAALSWGTLPVPASEAALSDPAGFARRVARELGLAEPSHRILLVQGFGDDPTLAAPSITALVV